MTRILQDQEQGYRYLPFGRNLSSKCRKQLLDTSVTTGLEVDNYRKVLLVLQVYKQKVS